MPLSDRAIARQNPWWTDPRGWEATDGHLRRLTEHAVVLPSQVAEAIDLTTRGLHVLRGPRQAGKSTELKLLVRRALAEGRSHRDVIYLSLEEMRGDAHAHVVDAVEGAKRTAGGDGPHLLLLDEVTAVDRWQSAVMTLFDLGLTDHDVVVCTGSSAVDLRHGSKERLPGRRGAGADHFVSPRSFAQFATALDGLIPASPSLSLDRLGGGDAQTVFADMHPYLPRLDQVLLRYARFGGLPAAVSEAASGAMEPTEATRRIIADSLVGEALRRGASEAASFALLERVVRSLGSKVSWNKLAREMDVPLGTGRDSARVSGTTMRSYLEFLAECYFLLIVYFWRPDSDSSALSRDKKLYFADPLLHTVAVDASPGLQPDLPALVENMVATALFGACGPRSRLADSFSDPDRLHVYATSGGGEIDFVCGRRADAVPVEVKYQASPDLRKAAAIPRAFPGRPAIIVTRDLLEARDAYILIPASLFLWALG